MMSLARAKRALLFRVRFTRGSKAIVAFGSAFKLAYAATAGTIVSGDVTASLGPDFFFDAAATGGNDNNATVFIRDISGYWASNALVTLKGLGWASSASGTMATNVSVTFTDAGGDSALGTADDVVVGVKTDGLIFSGASEYVWAFDSNIVYRATSAALRIQIEGFSNAAPANIRRKTTSGSSQEAVKLSLAGNAVGENSGSGLATAADSGFWEAIQWNTPTGAVSGMVPSTNTAAIGGERVVSYWGVPANQTVAGLNLGEDAAGRGRGTLIVSNGILHVTGDLSAGLGNSINDGQVKVYGGTLQVDGNVSLGRSTESADGLLELGGGVVTIGGDLQMGSVLTGGSLLRFHDPGLSPAIELGGTLLLGRAALALTFDSNYVHSPGAVIPLVTYATRDGQFVNHRQGDEFTSGPNRFRLNYDVPASGSRHAITLTCLTNYPASTGPNIVFILADDQGSADLRMHGDPKYPMPELEKLATSGVRFTQAYVSGGVCHPSRCGLLTGSYQQRYGVDNNLGGPSYNGLPASQRTVSQRLQAQGYRTYGIGKWHLGNTSEYYPNQRGFDRWYGINAGSRSYYNATGEDNQFQNDMVLRPQDEGLYVTDRIGNAAVAFIDEHLATSPGRPFYMYVAFTAVHAPMDIQANDARFQRLASEFNLNYTDYTPSIVFSGSTAATTQQNRYELAAMTLALDENIGKIVSKLSASGLSTNTMVVYLNDNGGAGWNASFGGNFSYNVPLRGYKGSSMTDGSTRVPAVLSWPGHVPADQVVTNPVISLDFMATAVNAGGQAPSPLRNGLDGLDLIPLVRDRVPLPEDRVLFWRAGDINSGGSAARMGDWKILADNASGVFKLYNLIKDVGEATDVAGANPAIFAELQARFQAWNSGNIEPFYGGDDLTVDAALERSGVRSGYRIHNRSVTPAYLTASLRRPVSTATNFSLGFYLRPAETNFGPAAQLWFSLGDSTTRTSLIRAGVDYGAGLLRLVEGKTGGMVTAPLSALPVKVTAGTLGYTATTKQLYFSCGGASVSLALGGTYGVLNTYGCGAAAMEGEVTQPFQPAFATEATQIFNPQPVRGKFTFIARYTGDTVFEPKLERSTNAHGPYTLETDALIESLGGGVYRFSTPISSGVTNEFFRVSFNRP